MSYDGKQPLLVVDGDCVMCTAWARFILRFDRRRQLRLAVTQSPLGRSLYRAYEQDPETTNLLIVDGVARVRSDAVLGALDLMGWPWRAAIIARLVPERWRNGAYDWIARHRLSFFGRRDVCLRPTPVESDRFLS